MAASILFAFFLSALAQDYLSITDPDELIYFPAYVAGSSAQPVLQADDPRFTRFSVNNEFSIAAWVLLDESITSFSGLKEILNVKGTQYCYAWLVVEGNATPKIIVSVGADGSTTTFEQLSQAAHTTEWLHVTMSVNDQLVKLQIGEYTAGIYSTKNTGTATGLIPWDSSQAYFQIGAADPVDSFEGLILDVRFYNEYLDLVQIGSLISSTTCHSTCSDCWGPSEWSCKDKIQASPIYTEITWTKYPYNDPIFARTQANWTGETSWAGFVKNTEPWDLDSGSLPYGQVIFLTGKYETGFWYNSNMLTLQSSTDATDTTIKMLFERSGNFADFVIFVDPYWLKDWSNDEYRWIGASFCAAEIILCVSDLNTNLICSEQTISNTPNMWMDPTYQLYLGIEDVTRQTAKLFKDVRYYMTGCKSKADLMALYSEQTQACTIGCLTCTDFQTWEACQIGRYLNSSTQTCLLCHRTCAACNSGFDTGCTACSSGYYLQNGLTICYESCAFGFTENDTTKVCDGVTGVVFEQNFNFSDQVYTYTSGTQVLRGETYNIENSDPVATTNRGFEFDGVDDIVTISGVPKLTINTNFTVTMWLRITSGSNGSGCALSKQTPNNTPFFQMCFVPDTSDTNLSLTVATISLQSVVELSDVQKSVTHGIWFIWAITGKLQINTGTSYTTNAGTSFSMFQSYVNNDLHAEKIEISTATQGTGLWDSDSNDFRLGAEHFTGNIYSLKLYNYYSSQSEIDTLSKVNPCQTENQCVKCVIGYLGPLETCDDACPSNYVSNSENDCEACHETCATCSATAQQDCITCIEGWRKITESSDCLCDMNILDNITVSLQVGWMKAPFSQQTISHSSQIDYIEVIASYPDLIIVDLGVVFDAIDGLYFEDTQAQSEFNEDLNQAAIRAMENSGVSSYAYNGTYVEAQLERGTAGSFVNAELLTSSGSGVLLASLDDLLWRDEQVQLSVISYDDSRIRENNETLAGQILSIQVFYLNDIEEEELPLTNLTNNVTVVLDGLNLNTTSDYECVNLLPNITWSTQGCHLSSLVNDVAQWSCNDLSNVVSMREVSNNFNATFDDETIEDFDLNTSSLSIICMAVIYGVYITLLWLFCNLDWNSEKRKNRIFVHSRTLSRKLRQGNRQVVEPQTGDPAESSQDRQMVVQDLESAAASPTNDQYIGMEFALASSGQQTKNTEQPQRDDDQILPKDDVPVATFQQSNSRDISIQIKPVDKLDTGRTNENQTNINALETEGELTGDPWIQEENPKPRCGKFRSIFLDDSIVLGMLFDKQGYISRAEKLTIMLVLLMLELYAIGLFYDSDRDPDEEEREDENSILQTIENLDWTDFWIIFYTMCITIPVPFLLTVIFRRKEIHPGEENITKKLKKMRINRKLGYSICFVVCIWCTWSIVAFSTAFGHNISQTWVVNFGITSLLEIICKDQVISIITAFVALYLPECQEKCKKKSQVDPVVDTQNSPKAGNHLILTE